jgi:hypothetical protein
MPTTFRRHLNRWQRWCLVGLAAVFIAVQLSPYQALATDAPPAPVRLEDNPLAQLEALPEGTVALPNFDLAVNGFQFSNQELIQAIDLSRNAKAWEDVLTAQLQQLFGTQVCVGGGAATCVLTAAAQSWLSTQLNRMQQGISEGMAAAVLDLWQPTPSRLPWWQRLINVLLGRTVFGLVRTLFDLQTFIANLFLMQGVSEVFLPTQTVRQTYSPSQILQSIVGVLLRGSRDPFTLGVYRLLGGALSEGHTLTPYRVEARGNGQYWVYVYDSNYPAGRSQTPADLHVEFDTRTDSWRYQPQADGPLFRGDAQSHTLDLTQRSWRHPPGAPPQTSPEDTPPPAFTGPFTCPFCTPTAEASPASPAGIEITLVGVGQITVAASDRPESGPRDLGSRDLDLDELGSRDLSPRESEGVALVPFKGGLGREVPASYHLPAEYLGQPLAITLTGSTAIQRQPTSLQLTGPGYTAHLNRLRLVPNQALTLYLVPHRTGPEITVVANRAMEMPELTIDLGDETTAYAFDSSTPATGPATSPATGFSRTQRRVSKSSGFELSDLKLPAGRRVGLMADQTLKRLYFADDDGSTSRYHLRVRNRLVIEDRIQIGDRHPDFVHYSLAYDEDMRAQGILVDGQTQAFFDYDPAFIDPAQLPRQQLLDALEQRDFPITIAYEPLTASPSGPLGLVPSGANPVGQRVFQGVLHKAAEKE